MIRIWNNRRGNRLLLTVVVGHGARLTLWQDQNVVLLRRFAWDEIPQAEAMADALVNLGEMEGEYARAAG